MNAPVIEGAIIAQRARVLGARRNRVKFELTPRQARALQGRAEGDVVDVETIDGVGYHGALLLLKRACGARGSVIVIAPRSAGGAWG